MSSAPGVCRSGWTIGPAAMRLSLFARARRATGGQRGERDGQTGEADDTVHDHVGVGDEVSQLRYDVGERQRVGDGGP